MVGEPGDHGPEVGADAVLVPDLADAPTAAADHVAKCGGFITSNPVANTIVSQLDLPAVLRDDAVRHDLPDPLGHELDVGLHERLEEVAADDDPLAADPVLGGQLRTDLRVRNLPLQVAEREALKPGQQPRRRTRPRMRSSLL